MDPRRALETAVDWRDTQSNVFPYAALVDGTWLVLRLNDFPEHPLYTLFAGGRHVADVDDAPDHWNRDCSETDALTPAERAVVLRLMSGLGPYGAETGQPCAGDWCTCSVLTDNFAARLSDRSSSERGSSG